MEGRAIDAFQLPNQRGEFSSLAFRNFARWEIRSE
jgi:hypothetical protein